MEVLCHIKNSQIVNRKTIANAFKSLKDGNYLLTFKPNNNRSLSQNAYFHGPMLDAVYTGLRDMGFDEVRTKNDAKNVIKGLFLKCHYINKDGGEGLEYVKDTSALTTIEFNSLIEDVQRWAIQYLNVDIASPNQQLSIYE